MNKCFRVFFFFTFIFDNEITKKKKNGEITNYKTKDKNSKLSIKSNKSEINLSENVSN